MEIIQMSCRDCGRAWWRTSWKGTPVRCPPCAMRVPRSGSHLPAGIPLEVRTCRCGEVFRVSQSNTRQVHCSRVCNKAATYELRCIRAGITPPSERRPQVCSREGCANEFFMRTDARYCSTECRQDAAYGRAKRAWRQVANAHSTTPEYLYAMLAAQGGTCLFCDATESANGRRLHVDHDHACCPETVGGKKSCGKCIRALLCDNCNLTLRKSNTPARLRRMADYLESHRALQAVAA